MYIAIELGHKYYDMVIIRKLTRVHRNRIGHKYYDMVIIRKLTRVHCNRIGHKYYDMVIIRKLTVHIALLKCVESFSVFSV